MSLPVICTIYSISLATHRARGSSLLLSFFGVAIVAVVEMKSRGSFGKMLGRQWLLADTAKRRQQQQRSTVHSIN